MIRTPPTCRTARRPAAVAAEALERRALLSAGTDRFLNPAAGNDANDGLTPQTAWRTVARLNVALAAPGSGNLVDRVVIDTGPAYPSPTPLYLDQPLILHPNAGGDSPDQPLELTGAYADQGVMADVRGFKPLAGPYTQPNPGNYPKVWATPDTQADVVLWEDRKWMAHPTGATFGAVAAALNATPGSFWTDGLTMYFHPFGSTDPNSDGKTYERSRNQWAHTLKQNASGIVLGRTNTGTPVANVFVHHLAVGGTTMAQANNGDGQGAYVIGGGTAGVSRIEDSYFYYGSKHIWCQTNDAAGAQVTLEDVQVEQGTPYAAQYPLTSFTTRPNVRHTFRRVVSRAWGGAIGSTQGMTHPPLASWATFFSHHGGGSFEALRFEDCQFSDRIEIGNGAIAELRVTRTATPTVTVRSTGVGSLVAEGSDFSFHYPYSVAADTAVTVRHSTVRQTATMSFPTWVRGSYRFEGNTFDLRANPSPGGPGTCLFQPHPQGGFGTLAFVGNAVIGTAEPRHFPIFGVIQAGQMVECDGNRYRIGAGRPVVYSLDGGAPLALPQWQALGFDGSSVVDNQGPAAAAVAGTLSPDPGAGPVDSATIAFDEPVTGFDVSDLRLAWTGAGGAGGTDQNLLTAEQTLATADNVTFVLGNLAGLTDRRGRYTLTLVAAGSGVRDRVDLALAAEAAGSWARGEPPIATGPADVQVDECALPTAVDLWAAFDDDHDADADLAFAVAGNTDPALFSSAAIDPAAGALILAYAPDGNGAATVTVEATDTDGLAARASFVVTVNPVNDAPSFHPGPGVTVDEDSGPQAFTGWATSIRAGPADEAGQSLAFEVTTDNDGLFADPVSVSADGTLHFKPAAGASGAAVVSVVLRDGGGTDRGGVDASPAAAFTVTVKPIDDPARLHLHDPAPLSVAEGTWAVKTGSVWDEDSDLAGVVLYASLGRAAFAPAAGASTEAWTWEYDAADDRVEQAVTVVARDGAGALIGEVSFDLTVTNADPHAADDVAELNEDGAVTLDVLGNDGDPAGPLADPLAVASVTAGAYGAAAVNPDGTVTYTPAADFWGTDTFSYTVTDGDGGLATAAVAVTVRPVNDAPSFTPGGDVAVARDAGPQALAGWASGVSAGPANEAEQSLTFEVAAAIAGLFTEPPTLGADGTLRFAAADGASGRALVTVVLRDGGGTDRGGADASAAHAFTITVGDPPFAAVAGRHVFYNQSFHDGNDPAANEADDAAIATDKRALLPGETATFSNYTSYSRGLNGLMVDIAGLPEGVTLTADDFGVLAGSGGDVETLSAVVPPQNITVRRGAGVGGSDRVMLAWTGGAVKGQWLALTVRATANTGLAADDVSYYGSAPGESGNWAGTPGTAALVNSVDEAAVRHRMRGSPVPTPVTSRWDFNRDGRVNLADVMVVRAGRTTDATALRLVTIQGAVAAPNRFAAAKAEDDEPGRRSEP